MCRVDRHMFQPVLPSIFYQYVMSSIFYSVYKQLSTPRISHKDGQNPLLIILLFLILIIILPEIATFSQNETKNKFRKFW